MQISFENALYEVKMNALCRGYVCRSVCDIV
jgi:hypothetical protein